MVARPVGLSVIRPEEPNRAFKILERKLYQAEGETLDPQKPYTYPYKAKGPKAVLEAQTPVG